ncbi:MAG: hypothetical protein II715_00005 [Clostridia bacterium]|nr:hypothetical protein [Clostridia bacterium]
MFGFFRKKSGKQEDDGIVVLRKPAPGACGGTHETLDTKAPKEILSEDMILFDVTSALGLCKRDGTETEEEKKLGFVSAFAVPDGNGRGFLLYLTTGEYARKRAPKKSAWAFVRKDVFPSLVSLVKECGLAKENGHHSQTAGLPENFGGSISVRYASGETISVSNNQSPVLRRETAFRIVRLFEEAMRGEKAVLPDLSDLSEICYEENRENGGYTKARLTILPDGSGVVRSSSKYDGPEIYDNEHPMEAGRVAGILSKIAENGILAWSGLPASAFGFRHDRTTSFLFRNGESVVIKGDKILPEGLSSVLWDVQREMTATR